VSGGFALCKGEVDRGLATQSIKGLINPAIKGLINPGWIGALGLLAHNFGGLPRIQLVFAHITVG
jgi:hypothetical protein